MLKLPETVQNLSIVSSLKRTMQLLSTHWIQGTCIYIYTVLYMYMFDLYGTGMVDIHHTGIPKRFRRCRFANDAGAS